LRGGRSGRRAPEKSGEVVHRTVPEPCDRLVHNINAVDGPWQPPGPPPELRRRPGKALEHERRRVLEELTAVRARERRWCRDVEQLESRAPRRKRELV